MEKLPDGRIKLGHFTGGRPYFVIEQHNAARDSFTNKDYRKALRHSVNAINAYEQSKITEGCMATGRLTNPAVGKLYYLAASCAQRLHNKQLAYRYAKKSTEADGNARNIALLSTTLANLGSVEEAVKHIRKALRKDPLNRKYQKLRRAYARMTEKLDQQGP
jgi:tetratricopeptide (TPR) repeat protein